MHEFSLVRALIEQVREIALNRGAEKVIEIVVAAGPLAGVEPLLLASAFEQLAAGTDLHGTRLTIRNVPLSIRCRACCALSSLEAWQFVCPVCESTMVNIVSGDSVVLQHVELGLADASEVGQ